MTDKDEEVASSKNNIFNKDQNAILNALFRTNSDEKPYPLGPHIPISSG